MVKRIGEAKAETLKAETGKADRSQSFLQELAEGAEQFPGGLETVAPVCDRRPDSDIRVIRVIRGKKDRGWGSEPRHRSLTADYADDADGDEEKAETLKRERRIEPNPFYRSSRREQSSFQAAWKL